NNSNNSNSNHTDVTGCAPDSGAAADTPATTLASRPRAWSLDAWSTPGLAIVRFFSGLGAGERRARLRANTEGGERGGDGDAARGCTTSSRADQGRRGNVRFSQKIRVVLVPSRGEMSPFRSDVWWGEKDYFYFRREYLIATRKQTSIDKDIARRKRSSKMAGRYTLEHDDVDDSDGDDDKNHHDDADSDGNGADSGGGDDDGGDRTGGHPRRVRDTGVGTRSGNASVAQPPPPPPPPSPTLESEQRSFATAPGELITLDEENRGETGRLVLDASADVGSDEGDVSGEGGEGSGKSSRNGVALPARFVDDDNAVVEQTGEIYHGDLRRKNALDTTGATAVAIGRVETLPRAECPSHSTHGHYNGDAEATPPDKPLTAPSTIKATF
ncbi:unnamed protein product, partial [Sphacelaria rigidula]